MRLDVERFGTVLVVLLTLATLVLLGADAALKLAGADLHAQVELARGGESPTGSRSPLGEQLAAALGSDVAPNDVESLDARAFVLDHRADRVLEAAAVVALVGMLAAFLTGRPAPDRAQVLDASTPLAGTRSNGSV